MIINNDIDFLYALRISSFNVISILTGTGYVTKDFNQWGDFPIVFFFSINVYWIEFINNMLICSILFW